MILYHATEADFDTFEKQPKKDPGFHFGTLEQARMRSRGKARILQVEISFHRAKRAKDQGQWTGDQISRARRAGYDAIVYLNRYEAMTTERIEELAQKGLLDRLDRLPDSAFRKLVPEAQDSYIVFDPDQIRILNVFEHDDPQENEEIGMRM